MLDNLEEYTVRVRGVEVQCRSIEQVVETVRALEPLVHGDREVPLPKASVEHAPSTNPIASAMYALYREEPKWRRPVEIIRALRKRGIRAKYTNVYAVLRYGDFVKDNGRWNVSDAA